MAPDSAMTGRVSGSCFDMRRSSQSASMRVRSETELSFETKVRTARCLASILARSEVRFGLVPILVLVCLVS